MHGFVDRSRDHDAARGFCLKGGTDVHTISGPLHEIKHDGYSPFRWLDEGVGMLAVRRVARKAFAPSEEQGETDDC
jgi:hypothetical protein